MAVTSIGIPGTHSGSEALLGQSYRFLDSMILQVAAEKFDAGVLLDFWGDLAGGGSDTMAKRRVGGIGWGASFTTMGSETEQISPSAMSAAMDTISIGRHGLAFEESFTRAILAGDGVTLEAIANTMVSSASKKLRSLLCAHIAASFGSNVADAAATADVDDCIAARAAFEDYAGFDASVPLIALLHGTQIKHIRASARSEAALKFPERFDADQSIQSQSGYRFSFLGIDFYASQDITLSSSDYFGGIWQKGAVGWAKASPSAVGDIQDANPVFVDELGMVITRDTRGGQATKRIDANLFAGIGQLSTDVIPAFLWRNQSA
jgi:hypothetical protein